METRWSSNSVAASPADINHYSKCPTQLESYLAHLQPALCCRSGEEGQNREEKRRKEKRQNREEQRREGKKRFTLSSFHQNNCRSDTRHLKINILFGYYILRLPRLCSHSTLIDYHNVSSVTAHLPLHATQQPTHTYLGNDWLHLCMIDLLITQ